MIIHTVAFKTKHPLGSAEEKDVLKAGIDLGNLPMVNNFQCYRQVSQKNEFEFGFSMEFESEEAYEAYNNHPDHVNFVSNRWIPEVETFLEIDYVKYQIT
ncbi:MAG: Dabb family protein [Chloroflexota bacterium]